MNETGFALQTEFITLGQLLKAAGVAGTGGETKAILAEDQVRVNGQLEARRGRKLRTGDVVQAGQTLIRIE